VPQKDTKLWTNFQNSFNIDSSSSVQTFTLRTGLLLHGLVLIKIKMLPIFNHQY